MRKLTVGLVLMLVLSAVPLVYAQEPAAQETAAAPAPAALPPQNEIKNSLEASENVTLDFKEADIRNVLKILAQKSGINIVPTPDVVGTITIKLVDVPWDRALDIILKSNGYGFQRQGNVILVTKIENMSKILADEPLRTEIINLKFLDAQDAQRILIPMLSSRGKISILYTRGQKGWKFGTFRIGTSEVSARALEREGDTSRLEPIAVEKTAGGGTVTSKIESEPSIKSRTILITDTDSVLDRIKTVILPLIDKKPKQVLIEARFVEVNIDKLKDIGFDYGTGSDGASSTDITQVTTSRNGAGVSTTSMGGHALGSQTSPPNFISKFGASDVLTFDEGMQMVFKKLTGTEFEVIVHALTEKADANTLSSPRILTLDNQEASMLVGYHTPILRSTVTAATSTGGSPTVTQDLNYYQEIGIRLNVVPQVSEEGFINMIIHPSITSSSSNVPAISQVGEGPDNTVTTYYPIIDTREVQTQILLKDGETVVIGGLLKDIKTKAMSGIPFVSDIPLLGAFFSRETTATSKVDLLIFITAHVVKEDEFSPEEIAKLEKNLQGYFARQDQKRKKDRK